MITILSGVVHRGWPRRPCYLSAPGAPGPNTPLHYCDHSHAWDRVPHPTVRDLSRFLARNVPERSRCVRLRLDPSDRRRREFRSSILAAVSATCSFYACFTLQLRRDAPLGSDLPQFLTNATSYNASVPLQDQIIFWNPLPADESWDGFALLVDDVERFVGTALNYSLAALQPGIIHFFRLAVSVSCRTLPLRNTYTSFCETVHERRNCR